MKESAITGKKFDHNLRNTVSIFMQQCVDTSSCLWAHGCLRVFPWLAAAFHIALSKVRKMERFSGTGFTPNTQKVAKHPLREAYALSIVSSMLFEHIYRFYSIRVA